MGKKLFSNILSEMLSWSRWRLSNGISSCVDSVFLSLRALINFLNVISHLIIYIIDDGDKRESPARFGEKLTNFVCLYISKCSEISSTFYLL